jgi:hypothetical protein
MLPKQYATFEYFPTIYKFIFFVNVILFTNVVLDIDDDPIGRAV